MSIDSKVIAKNTLLLYIRMIILMVVALYTSRIVFSALGVEDFGIYNVVGGVVMVLGFLNGTLSTASSRFIVVAIGENNIEKMQRVFSNVFFLNAILAIVVFIFAETIGLWFVINKMQIPIDRQYAAQWVYQISIITIIFNILSVPYNAAIIAHEKMKAFAYITLFDAFGKLALAYIVQIIHYDKLITYAILLLCIQIIDRIIYTQYCLRNFKETRIKRSLWDNKIFKEMLHFISWSSYGSFVSVGFTQGLNILLNLFFGPAVNAARSIAVQIQNTVLAFTNNFQTAINPQLMMSTSQKKYEDAQKLLIASSKFSFYMLCILGLPIIAETNIIIQFWLGSIPDYVVSFCRIILIISIFSSLANPLRMINQAQGDIKKFQLYECTLLLFIVPISYMVLRIWNIPILVFWVHLIIELIAQYIRLKIVLPKINISIKAYFNLVYIRIIPVFLIPILFIILINNLIEYGIFRLIVSSLIIELLIFTTIYLIGLSPTEKTYINSILKKKLRQAE